MTGKVFVFGDSILKGIVTREGAEPVGQSYYTIAPDNAVDYCSKRLKREIVNYSRFGSSILDGMKYFLRHKSKITKGDIVVLEYGGNDCDFLWDSIALDNRREHLSHTPITIFHDMFCKLIDEVRAIGATPLMISLPPLDSERFFRHVTRNCDSDKVKEWMNNDVNFTSNWHEQYNLDVFKIGKEKNVRVIDITSAFLEKRNLRDYICADGMHPNEKGQILIGKSIVSAVKAETTE